MFFGEQIPVAEEEEEDYTYPEEEAEDGDEEEEEEEEVRSPCSQGHRSSLRLKTSEGGSICILCFTNLISNPNSPSVHVSYALSQLSRAISNPSFLQNLRDFHVHLLISPLTQVLCNFDDEPIARQTIDLVSILCDSDDPTVCYDVIARIADRLSSGSLAWSRRQIYMLHSFGVLLNRRQMDDPLVHIKEKGRLIANLVTGLQLPSEEIRGEIMFVLYKLFMLQGSSGGDDVDDLLVFCPKLLYLSLEALLKTQSDEVRLNCVALLTVLAQRGYLDSSCDRPSKISGEVNNFMQAAELTIDGMISLFAEAIKGPLLSSDSQVQIGTLDLIFYCLSREGSVARHTELLVEENIADYVFEILRLSGYKDPLVNSCLKVLGLLSLAEQAFNQRLTIGFPTLVPVLRHLSEVPFHPVQSHTLKLIWSCVSNFPGIVSRSQLEELALILTGMFQRHTNGEIGMLPETFTLGCSIFVAILKSPSSHGISTLPASAQEASRHAVLSCLCDHRKHPSELLLYSLYLLKETHRYSLEVNSNTNTNSNNMELANSVIEVCETHLLPWITMVVDEMEEEDILGLIETFHSILLQGPEIQRKKFAEHIASSSWFSLSYGCLGLFPTEKMKWRVYLMLSSVVDGVLGHDSGQPIRDAALHLPPDPQDLLFLLGQKSCHDSDLLSCQSAILLILYTSSLYDERLAEEKQVLASLEQYILVNSSNFLCELVDPKMLLQLVHLYSLYRSSAKISYQIPYSPEAEKLLFHLIVEKECDPLSARTHPLAVKWLFQQENITRPLCHNILNFCRSNSTNSTNRTEITVHGNGNSTVDLQTIAELVAAGDNFGAKLLVFLFKQLQEDEGQEEDITLVVNLMVAIINIFPETSEQLCLHGIGSAMHSLYYFSSYSSSPYIFVTCLLLIFNILRSVQTETLFDNDIWIPVATKLLEISTPKIVADKCNQEGLLVLAILSLILHHSTNIALEEMSKAILLNTSLISTIKNIVQTSCAKGPALIDYDEETGNGQTLIFMLLLNFFSLRSLHSLPPGTVDWQYFLEPSDEAQPLSMICIHCHDLCRLIHFGSPPVKLVASHCLLELLTRISYQRSKNCHELNCSVRYLKSMMAVLEGLVFDNDIRVAINCALCISMILGWEKLGVKERRVIGEVKWCRLVVEELALSLAAPGLASESFTNQHKAATHVAVALLKLDQVPPWMRSVFDESCISGIVKNLSASSVSAEMVQLFRELLVSNYLKPDQISGLNHVFQACRKHVYTDSSQEGSIEECFEKVMSIPDDLDKVSRLLIRLMSTCSSPGMIPGGVQTENRRLLEEIDLFFHESSKRE